MLYKALDNGEIEYLWNKINDKFILDNSIIDESKFTNRMDRLKNEKMFYFLNRIDNWIFNATVTYFRELWAQWANLPLTTLMISSPWEEYAGKRLNYTNDILPMEIINRFWSGKRIFLSESSQFYLELYLMINWIDKVFSIYNSFRKEKADSTHLSEYQHIEFEWKIDHEENIKIYISLFEYIIEYLVKHNSKDLKFFLSDSQLDKKVKLVKNWYKRLSFHEALNILYKETKKDKYKEFTLKYFGTWEEVKLTELLWNNLLIEEFPMMQTPFYHAISDKTIDWKKVSKNSDFILYGYREAIWAWERINDYQTLLDKAEMFNIPKEDYLPYLTTRKNENYQTTSWFGMWWQRLVQWITNQPYIYESTVFPRTHLAPNP